MRILNESGCEIEQPDLSLGKLQSEQLLVAHHPAVAAVTQQGHYETLAEYENGGKDLKFVVDVPGVEAKDAWDEYEEIERRPIIGIKFP